ncbi:septation protein SepH [Microbacterium panaciterrae]|uniref:Septation protein SepH n=1 Tax=Microbacterium panaciterrae TaxID=985759 RepID=A0ABP8P9M8_9MICO
MEHVTIVGAEDDLLVLATEAGERFALPIDEVLRDQLRRAKAGREEKAPPLAASPREIQAQIRAGMSAPDVAELLGVSRAVVERFEGPVLAEREHIVGQALAVPVLIGSEVEPDAQPTFGVAIRAKLAELAAESERWAAWKDESGWIIKLEFRANDVDHDARWGFDPRRSALSPINADATQLSRQGSLPDGLIPRLRALDKDRPSPYKDETRFDSGAFGPRLVPAPAETEASADDEAVADAAEPRSARHPQSSSNAQEAATRSAAFAPSTPSDTADLLEALRRRRGQREARPSLEEEPADARPLALFEALEPGYEPDRTAEPEDETRTAPAEQDGGPRRRRREMPSWDEIVFGARSDD